MGEPSQLPEMQPDALAWCEVAKHDETGRWSVLIHSDKGKVLTIDCGDEGVADRVASRLYAAGIEQMVRRSDIGRKWRPNCRPKRADAATLALVQNAQALLDRASHSPKPDAA